MYSSQNSHDNGGDTPTLRDSPMKKDTGRKDYLLRKKRPPQFLPPMDHVPSVEDQIDDGNVLFSSLNLNDLPPVKPFVAETSHKRGHSKKRASSVIVLLEPRSKSERTHSRSVEAPKSQGNVQSEKIVDIDGECEGDDIELYKSESVNILEPVGLYEGAPDDVSSDSVHDNDNKNSFEEIIDLEASQNETFEHDTVCQSPPQSPEVRGGSEAVHIESFSNEEVIGTETQVEVVSDEDLPNSASPQSQHYQIVNNNAGNTTIEILISRDLLENDFADNDKTVNEEQDPMDRPSTSGPGFIADADGKQNDTEFEEVSEDVGVDHDNEKTARNTDDLKVNEAAEISEEPQDLAEGIGELLVDEGAVQPELYPGDQMTTLPQNGTDVVENIVKNSVQGKPGFREHASKRRRVPSMVETKKTLNGSPPPIIVPVIDKAKKVLKKTTRAHPPSQLIRSHINGESIQRTDKSNTKETISVEEKKTEKKKRRQYRSLQVRQDMDIRRKSLEIPFKDTGNKDASNVKRRKSFSLKRGSDTKRGSSETEKSPDGAVVSSTQSLSDKSNSLVEAAISKESGSTEVTLASEIGAKDVGKCLICRAKLEIIAVESYSSRANTPRPITTNGQ